MHFFCRAPGEPYGAHGFLFSAATRSGDTRDRHANICTRFSERPAQHLPHYGLTDGAFGIQCLLVDAQY